MIIPCPYCGPRDLSEFTYQGDATRTRPDPTSTDEAAWHAWIYVRSNPAGWHREYWQHSGGCRAHLVLRRNTLTHEIGEVHLTRHAQAGVEAPAAAGVEAAPAPAKPVKRTPKPAAPSARTRASGATRRKGAPK